MKCAMGAVTQLEIATEAKRSTRNYQPLASGRTTELSEPALAVSNRQLGSNWRRPLTDKKPLDL
jgi:hypothetical protein